MYLDFFSLTEKPFESTPNTRFFYFSPHHEEAIETLTYGIRERKGFMLLIGEVGTGKTTSIRELLNRLDTEVESALIINPLLSTHELLHSVTRDFGLKANGMKSVQDYLETLNRFLLQLADQGRNAVVIIDEAQNLSLEALEMLRLLSNLETETHKLIQLVLAGQNEMETKLDAPHLRQLRQRIQVRYTLPPFDLEQTKAYILHRIQCASPRCCLVFQPDAIEKIYGCTNGIPRLINSLCELTLLAAYTQETHIITKQLVETAFAELGDKSWVRPGRFSFLKRKGA